MDAGNLDRRGVVRRRVLGLVSLALGVGGGAWLVASGVGRGWRLALLPVFLFAALGLLQAHEKT
jgi:sirohydrochlorin ferrochelatase